MTATPTPPPEDLTGAVIGYRLGQVEKDVKELSGKVDVVVMQTSKSAEDRALLRYEVDNLKASRRNVIAYLTALSLLIIAACVTAALNAIRISGKG